MRSPLPTLLVTLTALAAVGAHALPAGAPAPQDARAQDEDPIRARRSPPVPPRPVLDPRLAALQGAWSLVQVDSPVARDAAFRHSGMMLVTDGFLSIELHLGMVAGERERMVEAYFQSGVHRIELDSFGQLVLTSVLGAEVSEEGRMSFEAPGERRLYRFELSGGRLVLTNLQRLSRLTFERVQHSPTTRDIYGREIRRDAEADDDAEERD